MSSWNKLLMQADPGGHVVQLYGGDDQLLAKNVSRYLAEGLRRLDGLAVIAIPTHIQAIARNLAEEGASAVHAAEREGRLVFLDARETLDRLLVDGRPDRSLFESVIGGVLSDVLTCSGSGNARAFGEMVSLLWAAGKRDEAAILEGFWNDLLAGSRCNLYCAYAIDLFAQGGAQTDVSAIVGAHSHLLAGHKTLLSSAGA